MCRISLGREWERAFLGERLKAVFRGVKQRSVWLILGVAKAVRRERAGGKGPDAKLKHLDSPEGQKGASAGPLAPK